MKKVLEGIKGASNLMNKAITPEVLKAMNSEQRALFDEAKKAGSLEEIKTMSKKLEKLNQNYK